MQPLAILILSDDRPGHYHLSEGVAAAIARRRPVAVTRLTIGRRRLAAGWVLATLVDRGASPGLILRLGYGLQTSQLPPAGLVISAGGQTLAANVAAARLLGAANIFCGSLRRIRPEAFSLVVSSYARHASEPRHLVALKPNGIDPDKLVGAAARARRERGTAPKLAGLLVGGDSGFFHYRPDEWQRLVEFLESSHREQGTRWVVATSRRSPDQVGDALQAVARRLESPVAELIDFRVSGPGGLPRLFGAVEAVLATEDSSTMISEAVCARLPVVGVAPADHAFKDDEREYRAFMRDQDWCRCMALGAITPARFVAALDEVTPLTENHIDRLAGQLAQRLPVLFR